MMRKLHPFWPSASAEHRMLYFGRFDLTPEEREAKAEKGIKETIDAKKAISGSAADRLPKNRLDAPIVDKQRAQDILEAELFAFLMQNTPKSAFYKGIVAKAEILEQSCPGRGTLLPLKFGLRGGELTIVSADDVYLDHALSRVAAEIETKESPAPSAAALLTEYDGEPAEQVVQRAEAMQRIIDKRTALREAFNYSEAQQWQVLKEVLSKFQSSFEKTVEATALIKKDPTQILRLNMGWAKQHPDQYKAIFVGAVAKKPELIPLILKANPNIMDEKTLAAKIMEASKENPLVLQYLPTESKRANVPKYRSDVIAGAVQNGNVLLFAAAEYDAFWKGVIAPDEDTYGKLCVNAVNQSPILFFQQSEWLKPNTAATLNGIVDLMSDEAKLAIVDMMLPTNLYAFQLVNGKHAGFISTLLEKGDMKSQTVISVARNERLWTFIQGSDPELHQLLREEVANLGSADMQKLRALPWISENEKLSEDVLRTFVDKIGTIDAAGAFTANPDIVGILRENGKDLATLPDILWKDPKYESLFLACFQARGELMRYAPDWVRDDQDWVMKAVKRNAGAFEHASLERRNDPEVLYRALLSDEKEKGEFYWKHVGALLKLRLEWRDIDGIPSSDDLLRVLVLGVGKEKPVLTAETVDSLIDDWLPALKDDPKLVEPYLLRHPEKPECILDLGETLRHDIFFVSKILRRIPRAFEHIDHAHFAHDAASKDQYRKCVVDAVLFDVLLFKSIPENERSQAEFIMDIINRTGKSELLQFAPESVRNDVPFLISVLQAMITKNDFKALLAFFKILPPDTAMDVLLKDGGGILLKLFEIFDDVETIVPPQALRGNLLYQILLTFKDNENRSRMARVLQCATPTARFEYFTEHPEDIVYILEKNPSGIARLLSNSLITVDLLATLAEGYAVSEIQTLFAELIAVKPMVLVGLLRRRNELWDVIGASMQDRMMTLLDMDTLILLRDGMQVREKERMGRDIGKALDDLRVYRQEAHYLMGLDPNLGKVSITWTDRKRYTAEHLFKWLDNERAPAIIAKAKNGEAKPADIYKEVNSLISLVQVLRTCINPITANKEALKQPFNSSVNADSIGQGEKTGELPARIAALGALIDVQKGIVLPRNASAADKKKAAEFLQSAKDEYTSQLRDMVKKLSETSLRGYSADQLRSYIRNVDKVYGAAFTHTKNTTDPFEKRLLNLMITDIVQLRLQAIQELRRVTEPQKIRDSEALYNLDAASLKLVDVVAKELNVDRVKFAKALDAQGTRNAHYLSEEYLPMLKTPQQWEKVIAIAEAFGGTRASLAGDIEAGRLDVFANCLMLSQERHSANIIKIIRGDSAFPLDFNGKPGTLNIKADRSMIIMASREMGTSFDAQRLVTIWKGIRERQFERFANSTDIKDGKAKAIDVFVIAEDDGPEGASRQVVSGSKELAVALNKQKAGSDGTVKGAHFVVDHQQFNNRLNEFKNLADDEVYITGDRHLVLRVMTHGKLSSGNALNIDPGEIASGLNSKSTTLLYTSCYGGNHLTKMYGESLKDSKVNVLAEASGTVTPLHADDMIDAKIEGAYEKDTNGHFVADFNGDGVVSLPEAFHWLDRNSSFQDPQGFGPWGQQFTGTEKGTSVERLA